MLRIDTQRLTRDIHAAIRNAISRINTGEIITDSLYWTTRNHVAARYPGSHHWSLDKIKKGESNRDSGSVDVDVAGANRAYNDITILPKRAKYLTIPIHSSAYGKKAADFDGLFKPKNKNILAKVMNGNLVALFALCKRAFQPKDSTLLPSDETFANNISERWVKAFFSEIKQ